MAFPLYATVFVDGLAPVPAAWFNSVRLQLPDAVDGAGGGTYAPTDPIVIDGDGLYVRNGHFRADQCIGITVLAGSTVQFNSTGDAVWLSGSSATQHSGATWFLSGTTNFQSGSATTFAANSHLTLAGDSVTVAQEDATITLQNGATLTLNAGAALQNSGLIGVNSGGIIQWHNGSSAVFDDSSTLTMADGATWTLNGALSLTSTNTTTFTGSTVNIGGGHTNFVAADINVSGGTIDYTSTAAITLGSNVTVSDASTTTKSSATTDGTQTDASTITRTGPTILSGDDAWNANRYVELSDASHSLDATTVDVVYLDAPSDTRTITLASPTSNQRVIVRFVLLGGVPSLDDYKWVLSGDYGSGDPAELGKNNPASGYITTSVTLHWTTRWRVVDKQIEPFS